MGKSRDEGESTGRDRSWGAVVYREIPVIYGKGTTRQYLLVKLASGMHWDSPKGHPETDESPRETARREIREEAGVEVRFIDGFLEDVSWVLPGGRPKDVGYFLAEKTGDAPAGGPEGEILDTAWLRFSEAIELATYESGRKVLQAAEKYLCAE